jgi:putative transposase
VPCLRQKPSEVGIVERPFGTINSEFFSSLPGYTGSNVAERSSKAESEASLTLMQLERLLVRYLVDNYNQRIDARMGDQSRIGRWEAGRIAQLPLLGERELDNCLMRRENRRVYRQGYLQFANLSYAGEHLGAYEGETVIIRYDPRDITTIFVYQYQEKKEVFLARAHATGWETESLSHEEARAISQRRRRAGEAISNRSMLEEIRDRDEEIEENKRQKRKKSKSRELPLREERSLNAETVISASEIEPSTEAKIEVTETEPKKKPVPYVNVIDYEELKRRGGMW